VSLEAHPLAELFPMMEGEQFANLVYDIEMHGLREPIITHEGKILDGRNRYAACARLDIEPLTRPWDGKGDPLSYVISKNLNRRHLDDSQRAMVATKIATLRSQDTLKTGDTLPVTQHFVTQSKAADLMNVSGRTVQKARVVVERGIPELQRAVEGGRVSVSAAEEVARRPEEQQREIVMRGDKAIVAAARELREKPKASKAQEAHYERKRENAVVWQQLKDALDLIRGMPHVDDVVRIVRANDRAGFVEARLARAVRFMEDFSNAWNNSVNRKDRKAEEGNARPEAGHGNAGNGSRAA